ncbi:hypothetical protein HETIRDRAFT_410793 [Heterobasidion irregulare TC 32-1]|uniref:Uncharacterized protein n=1 Tax=Heterobasidion irregulare (strain TC 32-1) TaxID=747525 RepID=W4JZ62_HETIT|nr:uncharacterized protein HETIRDRAFT_410793 [Heterobasidion irregulare TC 32-1]ETW78858.1 hypothetical protein HETIRDRAFT_410793 [Heterobasidion irregulare TC 32-1]
MIRASRLYNPKIYTIIHKYIVAYLCSRKALNLQGKEKAMEAAARVRFSRREEGEVKDKR